MRIVLSSLLIVLMLSSGITGALLPASNNSMAFAQVPEDNITNLDNFVVFGFEEVELKSKVLVESGNVGVNDGKIKIDKDTEFLDSDSFLVGNEIKIEKKAIVYDVFYNDLENKGTILGEEFTPLMQPVISELPTIPDFLPGDESIEVSKEKI